MIKKLRESQNHKRKVYMDEGPCTGSAGVVLESNDEHGLGPTGAVKVSVIAPVT